ncbi:MAG: hypothetical protein JW885_12060 [Deltaproteobacteria bacterium]|nr:hypothetical protein [Candidatus Zymogenaceae bacterium]
MPVDKPADKIKEIKRLMHDLKENDGVESVIAISFTDSNGRGRVETVAETISLPMAVFLIEMSRQAIFEGKRHVQNREDQTPGAPDPTISGKH